MRAAPRRARLPGLNRSLPARAAQGKLAANVWLLSAVAVLTEYPDAIPVLFADRTRGLQELTKARTCTHALRPNS